VSLLALHLPKSCTEVSHIAIGKKGTSLNEAMLNSEEIKAVAIAIIQLHLFEGIS